MSPKATHSLNRTTAGLAMSLVFVSFISQAATRYVDADSITPVWPYTNWSTAANTIQDAVEAADPSDVILVTNGVYRTGGRTGPLATGLTNRVTVVKGVILRSVNGPDVTFTEGYQVPGTTNGEGAVRCVYLSGGGTNRLHVNKRSNLEFLAPLRLLGRRCLLSGGRHAGLKLRSDRKLGLRVRRRCLGDDV
jgi:hypothetical protein